MKVASAVAALLLMAHAASAQEAVPASARSERSFQSPSGLHLRIAIDRPHATEEELAQALEAAARELRARSATRVTAPAQAPALPVAQASPLDNMAPLQAEPLPDKWTLGPSTQLWELPLANPQQPRLRLLRTSLDNAATVNTFDTNIGWIQGIFRCNPNQVPEEGIQLDFFGTVLSRFSDNTSLVAADYRFGFPLSFAWGPWQAKIAYEHTSAHLGDDAILLTGRAPVTYIRDEAVFGLARRFWDDFRVYGVVAYAGYLAAPVHESKPWRFDWGLEWNGRSKTTVWGRPFAALDMEMRGDQNNSVNFTGQIGWQWRGYDNGPSLRLALEYYDGRSQFGQFHFDRESFIGFGVLLGY